MNCNETKKPTIGMTIRFKPRYAEEPRVFELCPNGWWDRSYRYCVAPCLRDTLFAIADHISERPCVVSEKPPDILREDFESADWPPLGP